jgi:hypothetical protein
LKDWVRVINSQGNGLPNVSVRVIINQATNLVEVETQAHKMVDSNELEPKRLQVFKIDSFEIVNDPNRDPLSIIADSAEQESEENG